MTQAPYELYQDARNIKKRDKVEEEKVRVKLWGDKTTRSHENEYSSRSVRDT